MESKASRRERLMAQMSAQQAERGTDPQVYEPCGRLLYFYSSLYFLTKDRPLYVRVPESVLMGFNLPGTVYMHNRPDGSVAFEENCVPDFLEGVMSEWDALRKQCPDNPPIAIAQYIESDRVQSYAISGVNYAYNECTFLVFPDKVVQRFISPKVESGFFSNDPTVKTVWDRSTKTFAIEASQSRSPEPAMAAAAVAETLRSSPPTSHRSRSLTDGNKAKEGRSSSGHATEQIGRVSREELKRISCYLIEQINKFLKRRKGVKVANITLAFRRDYTNEWYFLFVEKLKVKKSRRHSKGREMQSPTARQANGKRTEEEAKDRRHSKLQKSVVEKPEDPPERLKLSRPSSREKMTEGDLHKQHSGDFKETARHRKSNTHYV